MSWSDVPYAVGDEVRPGSGPPQAMRHRRRVAEVLGACGGWLGLLALTYWTGSLVGPWPFLAMAGAALAAFSLLRAWDPWRGAAVVALWLTIGIGLGVQHRLGQVAEEWPALRAEVEEEAAAELNDALDRLVETGELAVQGAEAVAGGQEPATGATFNRLEELRRTTGVSALVVYRTDGSPIVWAGEHRGDVPVPVWRGRERYALHEGPLFSYLYFARPLGGDRTAVAAVLLESELPRSDEKAPFAEEFAQRHGLTPRFWLPDRARGETIWDWSADTPIMSVSFDALSQQHWWDRVQQRGRYAVGAALLLVLALLTVGWLRGDLRPRALPVLLGTAAFLLAPLREMLPAEALFSPLQFVLPLPWDITLGRLLILLVGVAIWLLGQFEREKASRRQIPWWAQAALVALYFPFALDVLRESASIGLRAGEITGRLALHLVGVLALALPVYLLLRLARGPARWARQGIAFWALALAFGFGAAVVLLWRPGAPYPIWTSSAWVLPYVVLALSVTGEPRRTLSLRAWVAAAALAVSVSLPFLWIQHVEAKLQGAEIELARLGTEADPFLDFLLHSFADQAEMFAAAGEEGINLLYHSWIGSGLAREGYEAHLNIWRDGEAQTELRLTTSTALPAVVPKVLAELGSIHEPVVQRFTQVDDLHYLLLVPLPDERLISVAIPPRRRVGRATPLARFLEPDSLAGPGGEIQSLYLVPAGADEALPPPSEAEQRFVAWQKTETGWRSEAYAHFPAGWMHAHLFVRTSTLPLLLTRAVLVGTLLLSLLLVPWAAARVVMHGRRALPALPGGWLRSFRGRLTLTLFAFFLLPTSAFAVAAYEAVSREVTRSAAGAALRALDQTVTNISRTPLDEVAREVGMDLLLYRGGALSGGSSPEVLDLGLFHSWLPPEVYIEFSTGEDLEDWEIRELGRNEYLVAYRRFNPETVFAAPTPLASEEIRRRQSEFRDVALLMGMLGALLSIVLSFFVGRALSRPLDALSRAAAAIGAGNLRVRLPEARRDEFGSVYRSFNRMAKRLRRARTALERETRRTETIVGEAATGVLALDPEGRVELVNPHASEILEVELERGQALPRSNPLVSAVAQAIDEFRASRAPESMRELEVEDRILRLRARRLNPEGPARGAVVALEDVTAEIRTARVLAWGEMARQVAHEIKNPLTPIKLAVQHLRRAYVDRRPDYGDILDRNVDAILHEIDRLGEIARAFSRFGTPQAAVEPVESVDLLATVDEMLALYRGAGEGIQYLARHECADGARALARSGELKEVLVNLLENAREAVGDEGRIELSVCRDPDSPWVDLTVTDDGEGIPPELLPRIFDPHFSTRTSGTGLGLAIVRRMVESWGGEAYAESHPGEGTRVTLRLRAG